MSHAFKGWLDSHPSEELAMLESLSWVWYKNNNDMHKYSNFQRVGDHRSSISVGCCETYHEE